MLHIKCAISLRSAQTGEALVSWAQKKAMNDREFGVKENAKKTGAFDDIFDKLRERGAKVGFAPSPLAL